MDSGMFPLGMYLNWFQNISILVLLILLYNYIPDRIFIRRGIYYSLLVGALFSFAAIMAVLIQWTETSRSNIGFNAILIPLAGITGGFISAGIITGILLIYQVLFEDGIGQNSEMMVLISTAVIGVGFYYLRERKILKVSPRWQLVLVSIVVALVTFTIIIFSFSQPVSTGLSIQEPGFQVGIIIAVGLFLLGSVILSIDQKKDRAFELMIYKEHLEALVQERTTDLEQMSALHQATIESTTDGIVVVDFWGMVRHYNKAAAHIFNIPGDPVLDNNLNIRDLIRDQVPDFEQIEKKFLEMSPSSDLLLSTNLVFLSGRIYEVYITPHQVGDQVLGRVINFRDITDRKHVEESLRVINQRLVLLSGITRHDILNQLTALELYLNLIIDETTDPIISEYTGKADQITKVIQLQVEFTRDYQDIGLHEPVWLNLAESFSRAAHSFGDQGLTFQSGDPEVEIYTDPLLERVFYNLIDNSIRHGERVTMIRISTFRKDDTLIIRYEDDGVGVLPQDKDKIFLNGYGKHTGLGMFLIQEILSITGIRIEEAGTYGEGVRFDITVPAGKFRLPD